MYSTRGKYKDMIQNCLICGSPAMDDPNAQKTGACSPQHALALLRMRGAGSRAAVPILIAREVSRAIEDLDPLNRKTVAGVDAGLVREEQKIANETKKNIARARRRARFRWCTLWFFRMGSLAGLADLAWRLYDLRYRLRGHL